MQLYGHGVIDSCINSECYKSGNMIVILSPAERVELAPEAKLESWTVQEIQSPNGTTYHFIGFIDGRGRISTGITEWHNDSKIGRTTSGRIYELIGPPGDVLSVELSALCRACAVKYGAISSRDVTKDFIGWRH